jgi:hypothetical protein
MDKEQFMSVQEFGGFLNLYYNTGIIWKTIDDIFSGFFLRKRAHFVKVVLLRGIYDGVSFSDNEIFNNSYKSSTSYDYKVNQLDKFYSNQENLSIPVAIALRIIVMQERNEDKKQIEEYLIAERDKWNIASPEVD